MHASFAELISSWSNDQAGTKARWNGPVLVQRTNTGGWYATTGISPDLMEATRQATREMIAHLVETYALSPVEAYALCSVVMDLKISEVVDAPNWVVTGFLPLSVFRGP